MLPSHGVRGVLPRPGLPSLTKDRSAWLDRIFSAIVAPPVCNGGQGLGASRQDPSGPINHLQKMPRYPTGLTLQDVTQERLQEYRGELILQEMWLNQNPFT